MKRNDDIQDYLDNLTKADLFCIIKYGLRGSDAPNEVTVEDIWNCIGCKYISETT